MIYAKLDWTHSRLAFLRNGGEVKLMLLWGLVLEQLARLWLWIGYSVPREFSVRVYFIGSLGETIRKRCLGWTCRRSQVPLITYFTSDCHQQRVQGWKVVPHWHLTFLSDQKEIGSTFQVHSPVCVISVLSLLLIFFSVCRAEIKVFRHAKLTWEFCEWLERKISKFLIRAELRISGTCSPNRLDRWMRFIWLWDVRCSDQCVLCSWSPEKRIGSQFRRKGRDGWLDAWLGTITEVWREKWNIYQGHKIGPHRNIRNGRHLSLLFHTFILVE